MFSILPTKGYNNVDKALLMNTNSYFYDHIQMFRGCFWMWIFGYHIF